MNQELVNNNYIYAPNFLTSEEASGLANEFFIAQQKGNLVTDQQCPKSLSTYNLMPCVKTLVNKLPKVSDLVGENVLPTYTYGRIYKNGEVLARHRDRDACEVSLTVNLYQSDSPWLIWIQKPNGEEVSVNLNPGDAMVYLGCIADHWRDKFEGDTHIQAFFHYVLADGPRSYAFFDRERR